GDGCRCDREVREHGRSEPPRVRRERAGGGRLQGRDLPGGRPVPVGARPRGDRRRPRLERPGARPGCARVRGGARVLAVANRVRCALARSRLVRLRRAARRLDESVARGAPRRDAVPGRLTARVAVIADTHLPRGARRLPDACVVELTRADLIVHAGDFVTLSVLEEPRELAPVEAVYGNMDEP